MKYHDLPRIVVMIIGSHICVLTSSLVFLGEAVVFRHGEGQGTCRYSQVIPSAIKFVGNPNSSIDGRDMTRLATHGWDFRMPRHPQKARISGFLKQNEMYKTILRENQQLYYSKILYITSTSMFQHKNSFGFFALPK